MTPRDTAFRLSTYYALLFSAVGVHLPFWPLWLAYHGLTPAQIGAAVATTYLVKVVVNPTMGHFADHWGQRRPAMTVLAAVAAVCWLGFALTGGFPWVLAVTVVAVGAWAAIMPLGEGLALAAAAQAGLDYGRIRLWGSAAFIIMATITGWLLQSHPPSILIWMVAATLALTALGCARLPETPSRRTGPNPPLAPLLSSPLFWAFLLGTSFNQASHTVYYAFSSIHWRQAGISDPVIGLLWSEGVLAEIVLFALAGRFTRSLGPGRLLMAAALAGIVRWAVLGTTTALPALALAQLLHAATFGCAHLGAMYYIQRQIPAGLTARAQGIYAACALGVVPGLSSPLAGWLYAQLVGGAFWVMTGFSVLSALACLHLISSGSKKPGG